MYHQANPFIKHAVWHGQMLLNESNRASAAARDLMAACDNIIFSINSGNIQGAAGAAQNARNMAAQVAEATQQVNRTLSERMEMASFVLTRIQFRINELANALNSLRGISQTVPNIEPWQHSTAAPYQQDFPQIM